MERSKATQELTDFFEESFRALKPNRLSESILALCHDALMEANAVTTINTTMERDAS